MRYSLSDHGRSGRAGGFRRLSLITCLLAVLLGVLDPATRSLGAVLATGPFVVSSDPGDPTLPDHPGSAAAIGIADGEFAAEAVLPAAPRLPVESRLDRVQPAPAPWGRDRMVPPLRRPPRSSQAL